MFRFQKTTGGHDGNLPEMMMDLSDRLNRRVVPVIGGNYSLSTGMTSVSSAIPTHGNYHNYHG